MNRKTKLQIAGLTFAGIIVNSISLGVMGLLIAPMLKEADVPMSVRILFGLAWGFATGIVTWGWIIPLCVYLWISDRKRRVLGSF